MRNPQRIKIQYGGITSAPDGSLSPDGELAACLGFETTDGGGKASCLRHAPQPLMHMPSTDWQVIRLHRMPSQTVALIRHDTESGSTTSTAYYWLDVTDGFPAAPVTDTIEANAIAGLADVDVAEVKYIGRTLICRAADGTLHYAIWKDSGYKYLGTHLPDPAITFGLRQTIEHLAENRELHASNLADGEDDPETIEAQSLFALPSFYDRVTQGDSDGHWNIAADDIQAVTEAVMAKVNKAVSACQEKGWFCQPFLVRYALRLVNGDVTMQSPPVLMPVAMPTMEGVAMPWARCDGSSQFCVEYVRAALDIAADATALASLQEWSDIVKGVVIAVSDPLYTYDPSAQCKTMLGKTGNGNTHFYEMTEFTSVKSIGAGNLLQWPEEVYPSGSATPLLLHTEYQYGNVRELSDPCAFRREGGLYQGQHTFSIYPGCTIILQGSSFGGSVYADFNTTDFEYVHVGEDINSGVYAFTNITSSVKNVTIRAEESDGIYKAHVLGNNWSGNTCTSNDDRLGFAPETSIVIPPPPIALAEIERKIRECGVFHEFVELELDHIPTERTIVKPKKNVLQYISTQPTLSDGYHTHDSIMADGMYVYNGRLNLCGVRRRLWQGFRPEVLWPWQSQTGSSYWGVRLRVEVKDGAQTHVVTSAMTVMPGIQQEAHLLGYLYYPDTHASRLWVEECEMYSGEVYIAREVTLVEHDALNGALALGDMAEIPDVSRTELWKLRAVAGLPEATAGVTSDEEKLYTSEAGNPWTYAATNINTLGNGKVLGMAVAARAISEGQAGQFPMYCMTGSGVWILEPNSTGGWGGKSIVLNDIVTVPQAIVELNDAVVMPTARGLVLLQGGEAQCLTDTNRSVCELTAGDLPGLTAALALSQFATRIPADVTAAPYKNVLVDVAEFIASAELRGTYDYRNDRILWWRGDRPVMLVCDLAAKQLYVQPWHIVGNVSSVGDCLCMMRDTLSTGTAEHWLVDFSAIGHTVTGTDAHPLALKHLGLIVTRPIKGDSVGMHDVRKQLDVLWHQGRYRRDTLNLLLWGTADYKHWHLIGQAANATGLYGHHGQHWTAFIIGLIVVDMPVADHIDSADLTLTARLAGKSAAMPGYAVSET